MDMELEIVNIVGEMVFKKSFDDIKDINKTHYSMHYKQHYHLWERLSKIKKEEIVKQL